MDYKKIIRSQKIRFQILNLLNVINDKTMIKMQYKIATGRKLNLISPKRYTEKLQWYKLYYRDRLMTVCADKYRVRKYVADKGCRDILVPLLGVYKNTDEIDFGRLPDQFVLKVTNGSHTNIICEDKEKLDKNHAKKCLSDWLKPSKGNPGREWAYHGITPRIICEKLLEKDENGDLIDYKFFCFYGRIFCINVMSERNSSYGVKTGIYNENFNKLPYYRKDLRMDRSIKTAPKNFNKMVAIAKKLSEDFPHVRVDLYSIKEKIYFGELTFYDGSGYQSYRLDKFDYIFGSRFILPKKLNPFQDKEAVDV